MAAVALFMIGIVVRVFVVCFGCSLGDAFVLLAKCCMMCKFDFDFDVGDYLPFVTLCFLFWSVNAVRLLFT